MSTRTRGVSVEAEVIEELPSRLYRVITGSGQRIIAHPAGQAEASFLRLLPGDRVEVELGASDPGRGRIVRKLEQDPAGTPAVRFGDRRERETR